MRSVPEPGRRIDERWVVLGVLTFARMAMGFQFQSVGAVSPLLIEQLDIGNTELGVLVGLFSLPGIALALPGDSWASDSVTGESCSRGWS